MLERWVAALRSGEYVQGTGQLLEISRVDGEHRWCCLGVLCNLFVEDEGYDIDWDLDDYGDQFNRYSINVNTECEVSYLPQFVADKMGMGTNGELNQTVYQNSAGEWGTDFDSRFSSEYDNLIDLNDQGVSFSVIADIIEKYPHLLVAPNE